MGTEVVVVVGAVVVVVVAIKEVVEVGLGVLIYLTKYPIEVLLLELTSVVVVVVDVKPGVRAPRPAPAGPLACLVLKSCSCGPSEMHAELVGHGWVAARNPALLQSVLLMPSMSAILDML